jgi:hypothetical protein
MPSHCETKNHPQSHVMQQGVRDCTPWKREFLGRAGIPRARSYLIDGASFFAWALSQTFVDALMLTK